MTTPSMRGARPEHERNTSTIEPDIPALCRALGVTLRGSPHDGWVVCDAQSQRVVGCIDSLRDGVELMEVSGGFSWSTHRSVEAALVHLHRMTPALHLVR